MRLDVIYNEDCLSGMRKLDRGGVDMILCDLPYGTTACKWDSVIPFEDLWAEYMRVISEDGAIVLFGAEPFSTELRHSNLKEYKYDWIWDKGNASNYPLAKKQPLKVTEDIMVFHSKRYYPQGIKPYGKIKKRGSTAKHFGANSELATENYQEYTNYPKNILRYVKRDTDKILHPTQKPTGLLSYLIRTYTNEGEIVLDNCMGSGSTAIACLHTRRHFIGFELDKHFYDEATARIDRYLVANGKDSVEGCYE